MRDAELRKLLDFLPHHFDAALVRGIQLQDPCAAHETEGDAGNLSIKKIV
jgi:hypothetical protein